MPSSAASRRQQSFERRALLAALAALGVQFASRPSSAAVAPGYEVREVELPTAPPRLGKTLVVLPRDARAPDSLPLLVLLHGLGETSAPRLGLRAWLEPYGLGTAWQRLQKGGVRQEQYDYWTASELDELNADLAARPFGGLCVVCPFLPKPSAAQPLDQYANYVADQLIPAVRSAVPAAAQSAAHTGVAGVSLGGYAALEVFLRRSDAFATLGSVQGAFGAGLAPVFARRLQSVAAAKRIYLATSVGDPYRAANEALSRALKEQGGRVEFSARRGPHSQGWLREVGSLETLLWHDRALRS